MTKNLLERDKNFHNFEKIDPLFKEIIRIIKEIKSERDKEIMRLFLNKMFIINK